MIKIQNASKSYRDSIVLNDINLEIEGGCIGLIGPNGAGKTTLIKAIFNLIRFNGSITIDGKSFNQYKKPCTTALGILLREFPVNMSVFNYLRSIAIAYDIEKSNLFKAFEKAQITSYLKKKISALSLGMSQRVSICVSMLIDSKYIIFDEPLNGLDPDSMIWFKNYILECKKANKTLIISSHILTELEKVADRFLFIKNGAIIADKKNKSENYVVVNASKDVLEKLKKKFSGELSSDNIKITSTLKEVNKYIQEEKLAILQVYESSVSLEEYYKNILRNQQ